MYIYIYIYIGQNLLKIKQSEMGGTICQNIKCSTLTHIPSSVQLNTWGRLED